jgi:hypothetical protein
MPPEGRFPLIRRLSLIVGLWVAGVATLYAISEGLVYLLAN